MKPISNNFLFLLTNHAKNVIKQQEGLRKKLKAFIRISLSLWFLNFFRYILGHFWKQL